VDAAVRWSRDSIIISRQRLCAFAPLREYHQLKMRFTQSREEERKAQSSLRRF
jgi:hypothetical protein